MNMKQFLALMIVFLLISSGCNTNTPKAVAPPENAPETQATASANPDEGVKVYIGPTIKE